MKTTQFSRDKSPTSESQTVRLVVYYAEPVDESLLRFISGVPATPTLDVHIIDGSARRNHKNLTVRVIRPAHALQAGGNRISLAESKSANALLAKCGPGSVHELLARYCAKIAASLVIVPMPPTSHLTSWRSASLPERLAYYFPVLAIPLGDISVPFDMAHRRLRWLVPLDGSPSAEAILNPLRSLASWLPSDITLIQPLEFARLWRQRLIRTDLASASRMYPSISDSWDYLARAAYRGFANSPTRVCCVTDSDGVRSIVRVANSSAIDAVAIGVSNRWRITRLLAAEFNELLFRQVRKPVLLFGRASR